MKKMTLVLATMVAVSLTASIPSSVVVSYAQEADTIPDEEASDATFSEIQPEEELVITDVQMAVSDESVAFRLGAGWQYVVLHGCFRRDACKHLAQHRR